MPYLRTATSSLYYETHGQGRPVVFIHCPTLSHTYWNPIVAMLTRNHCCVTYDLRGHGESADTATAWGLTDLADDLHALITHLELERPLVVGYSTGTAITLEYLLRYPGSAAGGVLCGGFAEARTLQLRGKLYAGLLTAWPGAARLQAFSVIATNNVGPAHKAAMRPCIDQVKPHALQRLHRSCLGLDLVPALPLIREPVMLVYGEKDGMARPCAPALQRGLRQVTLRVVPGVDHRVPTKRPVVFAGAVTEFALATRAGQPTTTWAPPPAYMIPTPAVQPHQLQP